MDFLPFIGAVMADHSAQAQAALQQVVQDWQDRVTIVGLIEHAQDASDQCAPGILVSIDDGKRFPIGQDLGCGAQGCTLDSGAVVEAGAWIEQKLDERVQLVVLSKFGKLEAELGRGLSGPLSAALDQGVPVLIAVSARYRDQWAAFAEGLFVPLPAEPAAIHAWLAGVLAKAAA
ncbi:DUF2478 domain-containing protein [Novosphingobium umbonatum]|uniref:DUF2478 domain-containing protein n=1 Tax=Novosphingobium umbonatum TaxID=1908524 RepID=A0A437N7D9_9SPHN|nr:DUF2478 domain-containing protein [Novosphingobium umbonatum]RVU05801.1 DUF2478 domain-containing protein [Novosphingobium umbonatum]